MEQSTVAQPGGPPADPPPATLGRYVVREEIARGGMGVVYAATDPTLDREVAVKVLAERLASHPPSVRRFFDEARISAQLQHPNIPPVHEVGTLPDGRPYLAMKRIKGKTWADLLAGRKHLERRSEPLATFEAVCEAVAYAHSRGVIHRDLKPQNVMVGAFGEVQVMDWGLAKVLTPDPPAGPDPAGNREAETVTDIRVPAADDDRTGYGTVMGTPAYMPPEQAGGETEKIDRRADVFSLGAVLCVILTGKPPYVGDSSDSVRLMAVRGDQTDALARLDAVNIEPELRHLCKQCLSPRCDVRPADAATLVAELTRVRMAREVKWQMSEMATDRDLAIRAVQEKERADALTDRLTHLDANRRKLQRELAARARKTRLLTAIMVLSVATNVYCLLYLTVWKR